MAEAPLGVVLSHIRRVADARTLAEASDGQLLERFACRREEAAFATLLRRHGPMVLSVSRRILHQMQDAEDVFQATFLLLARKAASIRKRESVGSWLHGVAFRLATRLRAQASRRAAHERQARAMRTTSAGLAAWQELQAVLDESLQKLSEKYRSALVLCYLEGKTQEEAARQLGCPLGTIRSRLAQGRKLLHDRLARRGLTLSAGALGTLMAADSLSAAVPAAMQDATLKAGLQFAAGNAADQLVSAAVAGLVKGGLRTMLGVKVKLMTAVVLVVTTITSAGVLGRGPGADQSAGGAAAPPAAREYIPVDLFQDITENSGVHFTYHNGEEAEQYTMLETLGGGVGLIDYDGDGLLDILIVGGGSFEAERIKGQGNRLYKNLGGGKFRDVTREAGLDQPIFYAHGCAVADYDCDGWPDLLVTGWGRLALYHNEPDGKGGRRFVDITKKAGLPEGLWTTSAAWADLDGDGFPDLYICQYVDWSFANNPKTVGTGAQRDICPPKMFKSLPHKLFRNNGDGTFSDVSKEAGLRPHTGDASKGSECGKGLGVVIADLNGDGKPDIYVANDTVDHFLYFNRSTPGKIVLEEAGLASGIARDDRGVPNGGKGVDIADFDGSGRASLWVTNYENELHGLYRNRGNRTFLFSSPACGIAAIGKAHVGFGTGFVDLDNDGWEDLVIANGHTEVHPGKSGRRQRPHLLRNKDGRFVDITVQGGRYFRTEHRGRGVAIGDLDNDGRLDLIISHVNEPVAVLRNQADTGNHWLGIELVGRDHRDIVGARIVVEVGGQRLTRFAKGGGSYLSSGDRRIFVGLGKTERLERITVHWPPHKGAPLHEEAWSGDQLRIDVHWRLQEGTPPQAPQRSK